MMPEALSWLWLQGVEMPDVKNCLSAHCLSKSVYPWILLSDEKLGDEVWGSEHDDHRVKDDTRPAQLVGPLHAGHVHHHLGGGNEDF